jgi:hypothetical protein
MTTSPLPPQDLWFKREENTSLWGGPDNLETSPLAIVETMALLHFPTLEGAGPALSLASGRYRKWILDGTQKKQEANPKLLLQEHIDGFEAVHMPFLARRKELLDLAQQKMVRLTAS